MRNTPKHEQCRRRIPTPRSRPCHRSVCAITRGFGNSYTVFTATSAGNLTIYTDAVTDSDGNITSINTAGFAPGDNTSAYLRTYSLVVSKGLTVPVIRVYSSAVEKFLVSALFLNLSIGHDIDIIAAADCAQAVRDDNDRHIL